LPFKIRLKHRPATGNFRLDC